MNKYTVEWTQIAQLDLDAIISYIALDSIDSALEVLHILKSKADELYSFPEKGRIVPELEFFNILTYRELIHSPWRIIYRVEKKKIFVMSVLDGRRNIEDILLKRLLSI